MIIDEFKIGSDEREIFNKNQITLIIRNSTFSDEFR